MDNLLNKFIIEGNKILCGKVEIGGSKNSVLPIMAASLLTEEMCIIKDVPALSDVFVMEDILKSCCSTTCFDQRQKTLNITGSNDNNCEPDNESMSKIRASFLVMGPLLAKYKYAKIPLPGGCSIGARPVDLHLKGFAALGAEIVNEHGYVIAKTSQLIGSKIYLDFPSVGATENIMMAATLAVGVTIIENCAVEPEIVDLANFLNSMGAKVKGAGTDTIKITGVDKLSGTEHTIIPDRIEAGTFMVAAAITGGDVEIINIVPDHLKPIIAKLREMNIQIDELDNSLRVFVNKNEKLKSVDIKTMTYPGFPTDLQSQFMTLLATVDGSSVVTETVFENRFMQVGELVRMGASIKIEGRSAVIDGGAKLMGTTVSATDLRAGASLILAGLVADGQSEISNIFHIERGYYQIEEKLRKLGACITRV